MVMQSGLHPAAIKDSVTSEWTRFLQKERGEVKRRKPFPLLRPLLL